MGIFKNIFHKVIKSYETYDVPGAELWLVSWNARWGEYSGNYNRVAKAFFNEKDADAFVESLRKAKELLQYTEKIDIKKEKQK